MSANTSNSSAIDASHIASAMFVGLFDLSGLAMAYIDVLVRQLPG